MRSQKQAFVAFSRRCGTSYGRWCTVSAKSGLFTPSTPVCVAAVWACRAITYSLKGCVLRSSWVKESSEQVRRSKEEKLDVQLNRW
jgi:hypothetical protein